MSQTDRQTDGTTIAYSEREREFTFAKNSPQSAALNAKIAKCVAIPDHKYGCFSLAAVVCAISNNETLVVRLQVRSNLLLDY